MAETPDPIPAHADADPATLAFEALREEVALVRRAVAGLAAERASIEVPDYSETLGQIMRASAAAAQNLKALAEMPALRRSAKDWGREIAFAADHRSAPACVGRFAALAIRTARPARGFSWR
jgi:hypothetical protein